MSFGYSKQVISQLKERGNAEELILIRSNEQIQKYVENEHVNAIVGTLGDAGNGLKSFIQHSMPTEKILVEAEIINIISEADLPIMFLCRSLEEQITKLVEIFNNNIEKPAKVETKFIVLVEIDAP